MDEEPAAVAAERVTTLAEELDEGAETREQLLQDTQRANLMVRAAEIFAADLDEAAKKLEGTQSTRVPEEPSFLSTLPTLELEPTTMEFAPPLRTVDESESARSWPSVPSVPSVLASSLAGTGSMTVEPPSTVAPLSDFSRPGTSEERERAALRPPTRERVPTGISEGEDEVSGFGVSPVAVSPVTGSERELAARVKELEQERDELKRQLELEAGARVFSSHAGFGLGQQLVEAAASDARAAPPVAWAESPTARSAGGETIFSSSTSGGYGAHIVESVCRFLDDTLSEWECPSSAEQIVETPSSVNVCVRELFDRGLSLSLEELDD